MTKNQNSRKKVFALLSALYLLFLLGCQASLSRLRPPLEEEGELYLYIQPFPQEADRLRFTIDDISVVSGEGKEIPLEIRLDELKSSETRRQRLLAHGHLPAGVYVGISFRIKKAILKVEDVESALLLPGC